MRTILWIGYGNLGRAIVDGVVDARALDAGEITIAATREETLARARERGHRAGRLDEILPDRLTDQHAPASHDFDTVFLAVKPQSWGEVAASLRAWRRDRRQPLLAVSVMAGVHSAAIRDALGEGARVIRAMPNTPVQVGAGMTAVAPCAAATPEDTAWVTALFGELGKTVPLPEELIDAATAVCGSGPAYFFLLAEALAEAARGVGIPAESARAMAAQTLIGAGRLLDARGGSPEELRAAVTSKGGTTAAGVGALESGGVHDLVARAVTAARDRGRELGS